MAMKPEDYDLFRKHIATRFHVKFLACPVCQTERWSLDGPLVLMSYSEELKAAVISGGGAPLVLMTCSHCFYTRTFAWLPIKAAHNG